MKIGIVTFFCVPNYGAMLQAYSLWKYLEERGHAIEFIDYTFGNTRRIPLWKCFVARHLGNCLDTVRRKLKAYVQFEITHFADTFPRTRRVSVFSDLVEIGKRYNVLIVGSDQMWNPAWCSEKHLPVVMLDFACNGVKRLSYAVSFGTREWRQNQNAELAGHLLRDFNAISVREESGMKLVYSLSGRDDAKWLLDPTLLHPSHFYWNLIEKPSHEVRYVFSYILDEWMNGDDIESIAEKVRHVRGIGEIRTDKIDVGGMLSFVCSVLRVQSKVPVLKWLSLIANADFVVTNSFHGTIFSILFHKPFLSVFIKGSLSGMNERLISLLRMLQLENRAVFADDESSILNVATTPIDWSLVDVVLKEKRIEVASFFDRMGL